MSWSRQYGLKLMSSHVASPAEAAEALWPEVDWSRAVELRGAFHDVVVAADGVARLSRRAGDEERLRRERAAYETVAAIGLAIPTPAVRSEVRRGGARSGFLVDTLPGHVRDDWDKTSLGALLNVIAHLRAIDISLVRLAPVRAWAGGSDWATLVADHLVPLLGDAGPVAREVTDTALAAEAQAPMCLIHGDLGTHNLLWVQDTLTGLIDLDCCAVGDPAIDLAPLVGQFGAASLREHCSSTELARAMVHRATLPLQVAAAALLGGDTALRDHALANFRRRSANGTLHDPNGTRPNEIAANSR